MSVSTKNNPEKQVVDALGDDEPIPLGTFRAWDSGEGGVVVPFPQPHARNAGLEGGGPVEIYLIPGEGIKVVPVDG